VWGAFLLPEFIMRRVYRFLRIFAVVVAAPVILLCIAAATLLHPLTAIRNRFRTALRLWMNVTDWVKGIPVGYSYWEQYEAPIMLAEIVVHHKE
jgi:hypothetical protein